MKKLILLVPVLWIAAGCDQADPKTHSLATGTSNQIRLQQTAGAETSQVDAIAATTLSSNGEQIVTSSSDGSLRVWDARSGQLLSTIPGTNPAAPRRYQKDNPDNMPNVGPDNFQILQDQIDGLQKRVEALERRLKAKP